MYYMAVISREGRQWLAEFPDAPGCQTFADSKEKLRAAAQEALHGWLEAHLDLERVPPRPKPRRHLTKRAGTLTIEVPPDLAVAVQLRWARQHSGRTQRELAQLAGVSQQQIAKLERPGENPTLGTLTKLAKALGVQLDIYLGEERRPVRTSVGR